MQVGQKSPVWVYAHPTMDEMASRIVQRCTFPATPLPQTGQNPMTERAGSSRGDVKIKIDRHISNDERNVEMKKTIKWAKFPDGFPNLFIDDVRNMAGKDVIFIGSFHSPDVIFEQLSIIYAIPRYLARSFTLILPYFPTGTMERVDTEGQIATAKTLATLLSSTPLTARGPAQIMVFDIHALQERFYFSENVIPRLETAIPLLHRELSKLDDEEPLAIAFPDDGAFKRFHSSFKEMPTVICYKVRDGANRIVKVKDGDPAGCHVVIVDDLVQTGGTLIQCAKALLERGAKKISAYVTHPVFPNNSWKKFVDSEVKFEHFWITDSLPHAQEIAEHAPFTLLSLADAIADVLLGYDLKQT